MMYRLKLRQTGKAESGQATTEYVLVLMVVLVTILGLVFQFNSSFRVYAKNYFGSYLQCLLETGELPNLGAVNAQSVCDSEYEPFTFVDGRPPSQQGSASTTNDSDSSSASTSEQGEDEAAEPGQASGGGGENTSGRPSRFSSTSSSRARGINVLRPKSFTDAGASRTDETNNGGTRTRRVVRFNQDGTPKVSENYNEEEGRLSYFRASKIEDEAVAGGLANASLDAGASGGQRPKRFEQTQAPKRSIQSEEEGSVSFSSFLRYLFIAAILIAVILFLFGQALTIQKSLEK